MPTASGAVPLVDHAASAGDIAAAAAAAATDAAAADAGGVGGAAVASVAAGTVLEDSLFQRADRMVGASMAAVAAAVQQLEHSVHATLDAQQGPAAAPAADWQVLQGALTRVLGLHHVRRVFSRLQLAQAGEAAAAEGAAGQEAGAAAVAHPTAASVDAARQAVGYTQLLPANATVHSALLAARRSARSMRGRRLIQVPAWARMPSELQQYWIRYTIVGAACTWGGVFMFRHSRLSGSPDLDNWLRSGVGMLRGAYADHVVGPLASVRDELFNTFRRRPTITSMADYEADRDSLQRMLGDFQRDFVSKRGAAAAAADRGGNSTPAALAPAGDPEDPQLLVGMDLVMRTYEREMQRPLRNLVGGELVRALLIQVQKLKVDTASAMLEMDQILKANELSISLLAAVPAFVIAGASLFYMGRMVTPTPPDPRREALPVRMAFVEVERALEHVAAAEDAAVAAAAAGTEPVAEAAAETREQQGLLAYRLAVAYEEARELFRRHRGLIAIGGSEWPNIRSDLLELGGPAAVTSKMRTAQRMGRSYAIFQQF